MGQATSSPARHADPVEEVLASMAAADEAADAAEPHVFISHAREQQQSVAGVIRARLMEKNLELDSELGPQLDVFMDLWSLQGGDRPLARIGAACRRADVGVVVLSPEFVRKKHCMAELRVLLQRAEFRSAGQHVAERQKSISNGQQDAAPASEQLYVQNTMPGVRLLPVLYGLTVEEVRGMRALYDSQPWCRGEPKPPPVVLDAWAADLQAAAGFTMIRPDQWQGYGQLADLVVERVVELLRAVGKVPGGQLLELRSYATPAPRVPLVDREAELQTAMQALAHWRYVEILGVPASGKSMLAQHASQALCKQWQQLTEAQAGGALAFAWEVDLQDCMEGGDLRAAVAAHIMHTVGMSGEQDSHWLWLIGWLRQPTVARVAILFEHAEEVILHEVCNKEWQLLLNQLHQLPNVHLIVVSRVPGPTIDQLAPVDTVVELQPLGEAQGMRLVEAHLGAGHAWGADGADEEAAQQLVQLLDANPLMLSVAAGLVRVRDLSWQDVLQGARQGCAATSARVGKEAGDRLWSYVATLQQWLGACLAEEEQQVLAAVAVFPGSFTPAGAAAVSGVAGLEQLQDVLAVLQGTSVVSQHMVNSVSSSDPDRAAQRYSMRRMLRGVAANLLQEDESAQCRCIQRFTHWMLQDSKGPGQLLLRCAPNGQQPDMALRLYLLRHELRNFAAVGCGLEVAAGAGDLEDLLESAGQVGGVLSDCGHGYAAKHLQQSAAQVAVETLGPQHLVTASSKFWLAVTIKGIGEVGEARQLQEEVLKVHAQGLGPEHPRTLSTKSGLAGTLCDMGELDGARRLQEEVLTAYTRVLGPEHPDTISVTIGLANTLNNMGELSGAQRLQEEALKAYTRVLGTEHPCTLMAKSGLASTLHSTGELSGAQELQEEVLEACVRLLGSEHPDTVKVKSDLASTLRGMGKLDAARQLWKEVLATCMRVLGPEHPRTLRAKSDLAALLRQMGELGEARLLQEEVLAASMRELGPEHPTTITAKKNMAVTMIEMGQLAEARQLQQELLKACMQVFGSEHPATLATKTSLAATLMEMRHMAEAMVLQAEVLQARTSVLGPDHPDILRLKSSVANTQWHAGMVGAAGETWEALVVAETAVLGPEHPSTLRTKLCLAGVKRDMGQTRMARQVVGEVLETCVQTLGQDHHVTLAAKQQLALTMKDMGEVEQARELEDEVLAGLVLAMGPRHPDTLAAKRNLAATLLYLGQQDDAQRLQREVWETFSTVFGADHPDTVNARRNMDAMLECATCQVGPFVSLRSPQVAATTTLEATVTAALATSLSISGGSTSSLPQAFTGGTSTAAKTCDVFISHAGEQKRGVVSHLVARLQEHYPELKVFVDYQMRGGDRAWPEIQERLIGAKAVVFVLSKEFVRKKYPMAELLLAREVARDSPRVLVPFMAPCLSVDNACNLKAEYVAEDTTWKDKPDDSTLLEWAEAVKWLLNGRSALLASNFLVEAGLVRQVAEDVVLQLRQAGHHIVRPPLLPLPRIVLDFQQRRQAVLAALAMHGAVLLHGMPGAGKTTLAMDAMRSARTDERLKRLAQAVVRLKPNMSDADIAAKQAALLKDLGRESKSSFAGPEEGQQLLAEALQNMELLLAVDNAWMSDQGSILCRVLPAKALLQAVQAKRIVLLVTSRDGRVADDWSGVAPQGWSGVHNVNVGLLEEQDARRLFCLHAFEGQQPPRELAGKLPDVLKRCGGLPMALEVMACHLKQDERKWSNWQTKLDQVFNTKYTEGRTGEEKLLFAAYRLSFDALPPEQQEALLDVALLLCGELWEDVSACYGEHLNDLAAASLVQCSIGVEVGHMGQGAWKPGGHGFGTGTEVVVVHDTVQEFCCWLVEHDRANVWGRRLMGRRRRATDILATRVCGAHCIEEQEEGVLNVQTKDEHPARILRLREAWLWPEPVHWPHAFPRLLFLELQWPQVGPSTALLQPNTPFSETEQLRVLRLKGDPEGPTPLWLQDSSRLLVLRLHHITLSKPSTCWGASTLAQLTALEHLSLHGVHNLGTLQVASLLSLNELNATACPDLTQIDLGPTPRPILSELHVADCPQLQALTLGQPNATPLKALRHLHVTACPELPSLDLSPCQALTSINLGACEKLRALHGLSALGALQELHAPQCSELQALEGLGACTAMRKIDLWQCCGLARGLQGLSSLTVLQDLQLADCMTLPQLPSLHGLPSLRRLEVFGCSMMQRLEVADCPSLRELLGLGPTTSSLRRLSLKACPQLAPPPAISMLTSLTALQLEHLALSAVVQLVPETAPAGGAAQQRPARDTVVLTALTQLQELRLEGLDLITSTRQGLHRHASPDTWLPALELLRIADKSRQRAEWAWDEGWQLLTLRQGQM